MKKIIATTNAPAAIGPYSQAIDCGSFLVTSGQVPFDPKTGEFVPGGIQEQTRQVFRNIKAIVEAADKLDVDVVLTCGGSGLSLRDVTPEATQDACERNVPGIAEAMRAHSLKITPYAMLSRALCMQRGSTLVINLPGSEKAARENWEGIVDVLPHAVSMMAGCGH